MTQATHWTHTIDQAPWVFFRKEDGALFGTPQNPCRDGHHRLHISSTGTVTLEGEAPIQTLTSALSPTEEREAALIPDEPSGVWYAYIEDGRLCAYSGRDNRAFCLQADGQEVEILWNSPGVTITDITTVVTTLTTFTADP